MIINFIKTILFFFIFVSISFALDPIYVYKDWSLFSVLLENKNTLCYMMSLPVEKGGDYKKRAEPFFVVMREKKAIYDEIVLSSGVLYNEDEDVEVEILKRKFPLFTDNEKAFTYDRNDDVEIIKYMKLGSKMYITGISKRNFFMNDTYSLVGFNEVYDKMLSICE